MVRSIALLLLIVWLMPLFASGQDQPYVKGYRVRLFVPAGSGWQSRDVTLTFDNDRIILRAPKDDFASEAIKYSEMNRVEYSRTKSHRKIGAGMAVASIFALPLLLGQVENHWLTINSEARETFLCLDKDNYEAVLLAFEVMLGRKVAGWDVPAAANQ